MSDHDLNADRTTLDWLELADASDAGATWSTASSLFRRAVGEEQWARSFGAARDPLGAVLSRTLRDARQVTELPGAPDGNYVVFQFDTRFARKQAAIETVTSMQDEDGTWRVCGYFIR